jgi:hypothetical protein
MANGRLRAEDQIRRVVDAERFGTPEPSMTSRPRLSPVAVSTLLFLPVPALFYLLTTAPGLAHADQAILIGAMHSGVLHSGATSHNLTVAIGYLALHGLPCGEMVYRANLVSTAFATFAVGVFFALAQRLTGNTLVAAFAALFLMVSHSMWWHATVAEVYAANAFLCVAILYCLLRFDHEGSVGWLDAAAALSGFAIFNHAQMGIWLPATAAAVAVGKHNQSRLSAAMRACLFYVLGFLPYAIIVVRDMLAGGSAANTMGEVAGGEFKNLFFTVTTQAFVATGRLFLLQWGWLSPYLAYCALGFVWLIRRREHRATSAAAAVAFAINTVFFAFYPTWDRFAFLLVSFVVLSYFGAVGLHLAWGALANRGRLGALAFLGVNTIACAHPLLFFSRLPETARTSSFWADYRVYPETRYTMVDGRYLANPDKGGYHATERYIRLTFDSLPPGSVILDHLARTFFQFQHAQRFRGQRPDVQVLSFVPEGLAVSRWPNGVGPDRAEALIADRAAAGDVYVTSLALGNFRGVVTRLLDRKITFIERRMANDAVIFQARPAADANLGAWVEQVQVERGNSPGVQVHFKPHNPPVQARVDWMDAGGARHAGRPLKIPFNAPPVVFAPEAALSAGQWTAEVFLFDECVATTPFVVR